MSQVNWQQPLEAHHPDGRVQRVTAVRMPHPLHDRYCVTPMLPDGRLRFVDSFRADGSHAYGRSDWRIRNVVYCDEPVYDDAPECSRSIRWGRVGAVVFGVVAWSIVIIWSVW